MKTINFMPGATIEERISALKKVCTTQSEETYNRTLTESEIEREKTNYVENGIRLKDVELEAKASADNFTAKKSVIKKSMDEQLERVQNRSRKVLDVLYGIPDNEGAMMRFYDKFGELISSRPLTPDEFNGRLFNNDGDSFNDGANVGTIAEIGFDAGPDNSEFDEAEVVDTETDLDPNAGVAPTDDDLPDFLKPDKDPETVAEDPEGSEKTLADTKKPRKKSSRSKDKPGE